MHNNEGDTFLTRLVTSPLPLSLPRMLCHITIILLKCMSFILICFIASLLVDILLSYPVLLLFRCIYVLQHFVILVDRHLKFLILKIKILKVGVLIFPIFLNLRYSY